MSKRVIIFALKAELSEAGQEVFNLCESQGWNVSVLDGNAMTPHEREAEEEQYMSSDLIILDSPKKMEEAPPTWPARDWDSPIATAAPVPYVLTHHSEDIPDELGKERARDRHGKNFYAHKFGGVGKRGRS